MTLPLKTSTRAIKLEFNNAKIWNSRGILYLTQGEYNQAIEDFNKAIKLDSNQANAYYNRGETCLLSWRMGQSMSGVNRMPKKEV